MASRASLLISCEHASCRVPAAYDQLFASVAGQRVLASHRGSDLGAESIARAFERRHACPAFYGRVTRLLVDLNRSPGHRGLFSEFARLLSETERQHLLDTYYWPYRSLVEQAIAAEVRKGARVVHVSVHSFTPWLDGQLRRADVGLLYDPQRPRESAFARAFRDRLVARSPELSVRRNYPYRGAADGFTSWLRRRFASTRYLGIEVEVNQRYFEAAVLRTARQRVVAALLDALPPLADERPSGQEVSRRAKRRRKATPGRDL